MLADGGGIKTKKREKLNKLVTELANRGVTFQICATTIRRENVDKNSINLHAEIVPSGIAQAAHLQQIGYLYIKP
jgi:intracellular sulfur oxidation DsrE/DsrF family protein